MRAYNISSFMDGMIFATTFLTMGLPYHAIIFIPCFVMNILSIIDFIMIIRNEEGLVTPLFTSMTEITNNNYKEVKE